MTPRKKNWALRKLRDWLMEVKEKDPITGVPRIKTIDWILSIRILDEVIHHTNDPNDNFDHISSLLLLMMLIGKIDKEGIKMDTPDEEEQIYTGAVLEEDQKYSGRHRAKFLQY